MVQKEKIRWRYIYPQTLNVFQENVTNSLVVSLNVGVRSTLPEEEKRNDFFTCSNIYSPLDVSLQPRFYHTWLENLHSIPTIPFILPARPWTISKNKVCVWVSVCLSVCHYRNNTDKIPTGGKRTLKILFHIYSMLMHANVYACIVSHVTDVSNNFLYFLNGNRQTDTDHWASRCSTSLRNPWWNL